MEAMKKNSWLSTYLYSSDSQDDFLQTEVSEFLKKINDWPWIKQYFFVRYWENGLHIRLRFNGDSHRLEMTLKPYIQNYFEYNQSKETAPSENIRRNIIRFVEYVPETDRYGGKDAVKVCERQFHLSSRVVLRIMVSSNPWSYEMALSSAIHLHVLFVRAVGLNVAQSKKFFELVLKKWFSRSMAIVIEENRSGTAFRAFEEVYRFHKDSLMKRVLSIWYANSDDLESVIKEWYIENVNLIARLQPMICISTVEKRDVSNLGDKCWNVYESLVHMTNNRLGILNRDESYLGFVLMKCFSELDEMELHIYKNRG